jgi:hypothetical protein
MLNPNSDLEKAVLAKLQAHGLTLNSEWNKIENCLNHCVSKTKCINTAKELIKNNDRPGGK